MKANLSKNSLVLVALTALAVALLSWPQARVQAADAAKAPAKIVNMHCPVMGGKIDPADVPANRQATFKDQQVGFCCGECVEAWDKLNDTDKQAALDKAMAMDPVVNYRCPIMGTKLDPTKVPAYMQREYKGQHVGLCCSECLTAWDKFNDKEKAAELGKVTTLEPVANVICPIMGTKTDPGRVPSTLRREFRGQTVGFCCSGCVEAWDKLTDEQKQEKLTPALPKTK